MDFVLGWNYNDQLYDNVKHTGWHIGYPDAPVRILPEPGREIPFELDILFFSLNFPLSLKAALTANPSLHAADKAEFIMWIPNRWLLQKCQLSAGCSSISYTGGLGQRNVKIGGTRFIATEDNGQSVFFAGGTSEHCTDLESFVV